MRSFNLQRWAVVLLFSGAWCVACQPGEVEKEAPVADSTDAVLPGAGDLDGWELTSEPESYGPDNLWDYINGQAEFYLSYGFVRVDAAEFRAENGASSVVVEVYQMAGPEEAFGIFAAERSPGDRPVEIGSGGYLGSNVLNFWQGRNYIKLLSFETGEASEDSLIALAREVSSKNPAGAGMPEMFSYFPDEGRIDGSERFFPRSFLGQEYLNRAYRIDYSLGSGPSIQLFLMELDSSQEARDALKRYTEFMASQGRRFDHQEGESTTMVADSGEATVVFVDDELLGGVLDAPSAEHGRVAADGLRTRIASMR